MAARTNWVLLGAVAVAAVFALTGGILLADFYYGNKHTIDASEFSGTVLQQPREVSAFSLKGTDSSPFGNAELQGQWTFMFFGFTHCGHVCPTTMAELAKMYQLLKEQQVMALPRVVMVSIDPERDSIEKLSRYVHAFNADFYGARGREEQFKPLTQELGIAYSRVAEKGQGDAKNYDIGHTGAIILFNPRGQLAAFFTSPHSAALMARDYRKLVQRG